MTWFTKSVAVLLLTLWVPVTMHCTLETMPGLSFLQSCCGVDEAEQAPSDCPDDFCGAVESGLYKMEDPATLAPGLVLVLAFAAWERVADLATDSTQHFFPASSAPPELPRFWQFSRRTALQPRAPSLIG